MTDLCFAYGSNINPKELERVRSDYRLSADDLKITGRGIIKGYALVFDYYSSTRNAGALDMSVCPDSVVHGVFIKCSEAGWRALDAKEGSNSRQPYYEKVMVNALTWDSLSPVRCYTYIVHADRRGDFCNPSQEYLSLVEEGMKIWQFPKEALDALHLASNGDSGANHVAQLFVYGTLMRGEKNAGLLYRRVPLLESVTASASIKGRLFDTGLGFPALLKGGSSHVFGDYIQLIGCKQDISDALKELDRLEGYTSDGPEIENLFKRDLVQIDVSGLPGFTESALGWVYSAGPEIEARIKAGRCKLIPNGSWQARG